MTYVRLYVRLLGEKENLRPSRKSATERLLSNFFGREGYVSECVTKCTPDRAYLLYAFVTISNPRRSGNDIVRACHGVKLSEDLRIIAETRPSSGNGNTKKQAKPAAAKSMLDILDGRAPSGGDGAKPTTAEGGKKPAGPQVGNKIGMLQVSLLKNPKLLIREA